MTKKHRTGNLYLRGNIYWLKYMLEGRLIRQSLETADATTAEAKRKAIMAPFMAAGRVDALAVIKGRLADAQTTAVNLAEDAHPPLAVADAWDKYTKANNRPDSGEHTLRDYEGYFDAFAVWIKKTHPGTTMLRDVTSSITGEYTTHLTAGRELSGNSFNKHVRFLELLFRVLKEDAQLTMNPWEGIQRKRAIMESRRELTIDELKNVCDAATGEMRMLFAIGIYTGLRLGDAATLRWGEVDLRRGQIRRIPSKVARRNPRPVIIPVHSVLGGILNEIPPGKRGQYVLPETAVMYLRDTSVLSKRIHDLFEACQVKTHRPGTGKTRIIDDKGKAKIIDSGKRAIVEVGFHSLRHTFVSMCREANAPLSVVESIVGHSNPAMTRHYTHTSELAAASAVNSLPSVMGDKAALALPAHPINIRDQVKSLADKLTGKNWKTVRSELLALAAANTGRDQGTYRSR